MFRSWDLMPSLQSELLTLGFHGRDLCVLAETTDQTELQVYPHGFECLQRLHFWPLRCLDKFWMNKSLLFSWCSFFFLFVFDLKKKNQTEVKHTFWATTGISLNWRPALEHLVHMCILRMLTSNVCGCFKSKTCYSSSVQYLHSQLQPRMIPLFLSPACYFLLSFILLCCGHISVHMATVLVVAYFTPSASVLLFQGHAWYAQSWWGLNFMTAGCQKAADCTYCT